MGEDRNLLHCLNDLPISDEPLTRPEMERLTRTVLQRTQSRTAAESARRNRKKWPLWGRLLASGAACLVLLAGLNGINPALAEQLPLLGDVFAYFHTLPKGHLQSDQLSEYAQSMQLPADSGETPQESAAPAASPQRDTPEERPCRLTLRQVYCDELYLRVGLTLTAEGDALAGFEVVTIDPPLLQEDTSPEEANTLYGGVTLNGEPVGGDLVPCFRKQDDHTFFCEMDYNLQNYTGDTRDMQASLTLSNLVGVSLGDGAVGSEEKTPLEGSYTLSFTVSADGTLTREGQIEGGEQNHLNLLSVKATPGETCIAYTVNGPLPGGGTPALRAFAVQGNTKTRLEPAGGTIEQADDASCTVYTDYLDAVPQGVQELCVQVLDKNAEEEVILAQWTVTLPD